MTLRQTLKNKFLMCISKHFDVAIVVATQKPAIEIDRVYSLKMDGDPFRYQFFVKICDMKDGYVQYVPCDAAGRVSDFCIKMSNSIKAFNICYKQVNT